VLTGLAEKCAISQWLHMDPKWLKISDRTGSDLFGVGLELTPVFRGRGYYILAVLFLGIYFSCII